jgi:integrase
MSVYRRKWKDEKTGEIRLGSYFFKFEIDGQVYKETVKTARTKKQAEEAERQARDAVHQGVFGHTGKRQLFSTFAREVYMKWAEQHHRNMYDERLRVNLLCEHFKGLTLAQISQLAVKRFKLGYARTPTRWDKPRAPRTVNIALETLSSILTKAVDMKYLRENPCRRVRKLEVDDTEPARVGGVVEESLLAAAEQVPVAPYLRPMIQLALWTGLRQSELIALRRSSVNFSRNRLYVSNPKWRRDRRKIEGVPLSAAARELLEDLCRRAQGDVLFTNSAGEVPTRQAVECAFKRACAKAGITGLRFHYLRHEYGSRLGDADVNLKKIARLMGHSRTRMTERYVPPDDAGLLTATEVAASGGRTRIVPEGLQALGGKSS